MSFDVGIKITSEADLGALKLSEEATRKVGEELKKINGITAGAGAAQGLQQTAVAAEKLAGSARPLNQAMNMLAPQLGLLGPVGNVAGNALLGLSTGIGSLAIAGGAAVVGIQAFANALQQSNAEAANFSKAIRTKDIGFFAENLERLNQIKSDRSSDNIFITGLKTIGGLFGDTDRLVVDLDGKIADYNEQLKNIDASKAREVTEAFRIQAEAIGTGPIGKINAAMAEATQQANKAHDAGKVEREEHLAQLAGIQSIGAASVAEFNRGLTEQIALLNAANNPLEQIEIKMQSLRRGADSGTLGNLGELQRLQENAARIAAGSPLVAQGFSAIGAAAVLPKTQLDQLAISAFNLDQKFQSGMITARQYSDGLKNIAGGALPANQQAFTGIADNLRKEIDSMSRQEFPDKFRFQEIADQAKALGQAARAAFGTEIPAAVQASIEKVSSLTQQISSEKGFTLEVNSTGVQVAFDTLRGQLGDLQRLGQDGFSLTADTSQADAQIQSMISKIQAMRAEASRPIDLTLDAGVTSSPRRPFSEWMDSYAPGKIDALGKKAGSMEFSMDGGGLGVSGGGAGRAGNASAGEIAALTRDANAYISEAGDIYTPGMTAFMQGRKLAAQDALNRLTGTSANGIGGAIVERRRAAASGETAGADSSGGGGGGGGGASGEVNITINIGSVTQELLDRELLPRFEGAVKQATGKSPSYRVLN